MFDSSASPAPKPKNMQVTARCRSEVYRSSCRLRARRSCRSGDGLRRLRLNRHYRPEQLTMRGLRPAEMTKESSSHPHAQPHPLPAPRRRRHASARSRAAHHERPDPSLDTDGSDRASSSVSASAARTYVNKGLVGVGVFAASTLDRRPRRHASVPSPPSRSTPLPGARTPTAPTPATLYTLPDRGYNVAGLIAYAGPHPADRPDLHPGLHRRQRRRRPS
jgi:hypothetical protein